jgi:hypothetical protein
MIPLPGWEGMKGRGISNLKEFFNSSPSPYPLPSRERGNGLIFSQLPPPRGRVRVGAEDAKGEVL